MVKILSTIYLKLTRYIIKKKRLNQIVDFYNTK